MAHLEKRGENSWRVTVSCGIGPDGKQIKKRRTIKAANEREAKKKAAVIEAEVHNGLFIDPTKLTLADFVERWLRDYAEKNLDPKTVEGYKEKLTRILQALGHLKIEKIKPTHLLEFYANLQEDGIRKDGKPGGLSPNNIRHHHRVISSILNDAVEWQVIPSNPASRVKPPKVPKKRASCYDEEQTAAMLAALENEPLKYKVAIIVTIATGVREGELMGIEWGDVDFDNNTIEIRQASQYLPGKGVFTKDPKNETSKRVISVPTSVMALLKQYKAHQGKERLKVGDLWRGSGLLSAFTELFNAVTPKELSGTQLLKNLNSQNEKWEENLKVISSRANNEEFIQELSKFGAKAAPEIAALNTLSDKQLQDFIALWQEKSKDSRGGRLFTTWDGRPMHTYTVGAWFPKFLKRHGLPPLPFHGLRHTSATLLIDQGLHAKVISERLGHANIGTTMDIYGHYLKSADKKAADKLDHLFNGNGKNEAQSK